MTRDELMQIGHDAGFDTSELTGEVIALLECVAEHAEAKERTARIEAQQRLADMKKLAAKAGLAHRKAVQEAVREAIADGEFDERNACIECCDTRARELQTEGDEHGASVAEGIATSLRHRGTS